jgi:hypothetical protein
LLLREALQRKEQELESLRGLVAQLSEVVESPQREGRKTVLRHARVQTEEKWEELSSLSRQLRR